MQMGLLAYITAGDEGRDPLMCPSCRDGVAGETADASEAEAPPFFFFPFFPQLSLRRRSTERLLFGSNRHRSDSTVLPPGQMKALS